MEILLLKIEPSEITPVFYNNFFRFGGGEFSPRSPPGYATAFCKLIQSWKKDTNLNKDTFRWWGWIRGWIFSKTFYIKNAEYSLNFWYSSFSTNSRDLISKIYRTDLKIRHLKTCTIPSRTHDRRVLIACNHFILH